jgi:23S rRNA (cytosine1962-C5)-methyltransferase
VLVEEHGLSLAVDLRRGQKTGLFLDQRENRFYVEGRAAGARVLNLFGYTGGFSLSAARGGALHVTTVDVAPDAIAAARENFALNGFDPARHAFVVDDVFDYLKKADERGDRFDVVVCDPPSFARRQAQIEKAASAYVRLHTAGLRVTRPGGLYAAGSCTARVSASDFHEILARAGRNARRRCRIVHDAGQPADHPVLLGHPEGRYLKFVVLAT